MGEATGPVSAEPGAAEPLETCHRSRNGPPHTDVPLRGALLVAFRRRSDEKRRRRILGTVPVPASVSDWLGNCGESSRLVLRFASTAGNSLLLFTIAGMVASVFL